MGQELTRFSQTPIRRKPQNFWDRWKDALAPETDPTDILRKETQYFEAVGGRANAERSALIQAMDLHVLRTTLQDEFSLRVREKQVELMEIEWSLEERLETLQEKKELAKRRKARRDLANEYGLDEEELEILLRNARDRRFSQR